MRIVVTGAAGFIGSHLVERLARERAGEIVAIDNFHRGRVENLASCRDQIVLVKGDVRDRRLLWHHMRRAEIVFHLAAESRVLAAARDPDYAFSTNVAGTYQVLSAAHEADVRRVVFASSREVYGEPHALPVPESAPLLPKNAYGASKAAGEMWARAYAAAGLETAVLRLANVYGPRDQGRVVPACIEKALLDEPLTLYGGHQVLDLVWIGIVVEALMKAAFGDPVGEPLNIGSGTGTSISVLARRILDLTRSRSPIGIAPARGSEVVRFVADIGKARRVLGLVPPQDPLLELESVVQWMRQKLRSRENLPDAKSVPHRAAASTIRRARGSDALQPTPWKLRK